MKSESTTVRDPTAFSTKRALSAVVTLGRVCWALLRGASLPTVQRGLYSLVYVSPMVRRMRFFNYGYAPIAADLHKLPELANEPFQATLYHRVLVAAEKELGHVPENVVEVACSRGGGLLYASVLFPGAEHLTGLDLQADAIAGAQMLQASGNRLHFAAASGHALPLRNHSVVLLVCVEALMNLHRRRFLQESARVVTSKGVIATTGSQHGSFEAARSELTAQAEASGLVLAKMDDITANIVAACEQDSPRRLAHIARAPWFTRAYLRDFLGVPGARKFRAYQSHERCYYLAVFRRKEQSELPG